MNPYQPGEDNQDPYEVGYKAGAASLAEQIASLKDELRQISTAIDDVRLDLTNTAAELIMEMKERLASRDAEVVSLTNQRDYEYVRAENAEQERDQLREQVKMLRDALEVTHELYANASSGYGFARPKNPHNFCPDINGCSKEEIAAHSKACDDYSAGRRVADESWGVGTYNDEYAPALEALAATEPK